MVVTIEDNYAGNETIPSISQEFCRFDWYFISSYQERFSFDLGFAFIFLIRGISLTNRIHFEFADVFSI